jgi:SAM-dependent methyltransferase
MDLKNQFGNLDIYLFDQLLRGQIKPGMRVLDAGCGNGRNLAYLLRAGFNVMAVDESENAITQVRALARQLAPEIPESSFRAEPVEAMTFPDHSADATICNAVLHFARAEAHFQEMVREIWRILSPGGIFFARLASTIGMDMSAFEPLPNRRFIQPDGDERFLVDAPFLLATTESLGGQLVDPLKTTVVHEKRCMTTWVVRKTDR